MKFYEQMEANCKYAIESNISHELNGVQKTYNDEFGKLGYMNWTSHVTDIHSPFHRQFGNGSGRCPRSRVSDGLFHIVVPGGKRCVVSEEAKSIYTTKSGYDLSSSSGLAKYLIQNIGYHHDHIKYGESVPNVYLMCNEYQVTLLLVDDPKNKPLIEKYLAYPGVDWDVIPSDMIEKNKDLLSIIEDDLSNNRLQYRTISVSEINSFKEVVDIIINLFSYVQIPPIKVTYRNIISFVRDLMLNNVITKTPSLKQNLINFGLFMKQDEKFLNSSLVDKTELSKLENRWEIGEYLSTIDYGMLTKTKQKKNLKDNYIPYGSILEFIYDRSITVRVADSHLVKWQGLLWGKGAGKANSFKNLIILLIRKSGRKKGEWCENFLDNPMSALLYDGISVKSISLDNNIRCKEFLKYFT